MVPGATCRRNRSGRSRECPQHDRQKTQVLDDGDRRALQYASIQGEEFLSTVLAASREVDDLTLEERLDRLERLHRLIQTRGEEELPDGSLATRYRFAHALFKIISTPIS